MRILMTPEVFLRLWYHIETTRTEIGGMGYANFNDDGDLLWSKVFLCPQIASMAEVDFEETGGDAFAIERAVGDGVLNDPTFVWASWHSHAQTSTFWSPTDDTRIASLRKAGIEHVFSFVGNHERKYRARFDAFNIDRGHYSIPHVIMDNLKVELDPDEAIFRECDAEYERCVQVKTYQMYETGYTYKSPTQPKPSESDWLNAEEAAALLITQGG